MEILRGMEDNSVNFVWTQVVNPFQAAPNSNHWLKAARHPENFVVVADAYPTFSCQYADLILPAAMIFEKWGLYGNANVVHKAGSRWPILPEKLVPICG